MVDLINAVELTRGRGIIPFLDRQSYTDFSYIIIRSMLRVFVFYILLHYNYCLCSL